MLNLSQAINFYRKQFCELYFIAIFRFFFRPRLKLIGLFCTFVMAEANRYRLMTRLTGQKLPFLPSGSIIKGTKHDAKMYSIELMGLEQILEFKIIVIYYVFKLWKVQLICFWKDAKRRAVIKYVAAE